MNMYENNEKNYYENHLCKKIEIFCKKILENCNIAENFTKKTL